MILECLRHLRILGIFCIWEEFEFGERAEGRLLGAKLCLPLKCAEVLFPGPQDGIYLGIGLLQEAWVQSLGWEDPLEKGKATHYSILAWRIPWTV